MSHYDMKINNVCMEQTMRIMESLQKTSYLKKEKVMGYRIAW